MQSTTFRELFGPNLFIIFRIPSLFIFPPFQISSITTENVGLFRNAVNKLTDTMDMNIKIMYTIMAKTEEINKKIKETEEIYQKM